MSIVRFPRCTPSLLQLEDRWTPTTFWVSKLNWDATVPFSLPWAIAQANSPANPGQDQIFFVFKALPPNPVINATSTLTVTEGVYIQGASGNDYVTLSGVRPFDFNHPGTASVLDRVNFVTCVAPAGTSGGAIRVEGGTVTLATSRFVNNSTGVNGGAVFVDTSGTLEVDGYAPGPVAWAPQQNQPRTLFKQNTTAAGGFGGAIEDKGTVILKRGWFIQNSAAGKGGAIDVAGTGVLSAPQLPGPSGPVDPDVQILSNTAGTEGGGVYFDSTATSTLYGVIFGYNQAGTNGGGFAAKDGTINLNGGTVANNKAGVGQGGYVTSATVNATGVSFFGNVDLLGKAGNPVEIGSNGILNTSGCLFNGNGTPVVIAGTNGQWNSDGTDTP